LSAQLLLRAREQAVRDGGRLAPGSTAAIRVCTRLRTRRGRELPGCCARACVPSGLVTEQGSKLPDLGQSGARPAAKPSLASPQPSHPRTPSLDAAHPSLLSSEHIHPASRSGASPHRVHVVPARPVRIS
jgi:hypothetical protein